MGERVVGQDDDACGRDASVHRAQRLEHHVHPLAHVGDGAGRKHGEELVRGACGHADADSIDLALGPEECDDLPARGIEFVGIGLCANELELDALAARCGGKAMPVGEHPCSAPVIGFELLLVGQLDQVHEPLAYGIGRGGCDPLQARGDELKEFRPVVDGQSGFDLMGGLPCRRDCLRRQDLKLAPRLGPVVHVLQVVDHIGQLNAGKVLEVASACPIPVNALALWVVPIGNAAPTRAGPADKRVDVTLEVRLKTLAKSPGPLCKAADRGLHIEARLLAGRHRLGAQLEADGVSEAVVPKNLREQLARGAVAAQDALEVEVLPAGEVAGLAVDPV